MAQLTALSAGKKTLPDTPAPQDEGIFDETHRRMLCHSGSRIAGVAVSPRDSQRLLLLSPSYGGRMVIDHFLDIDGTLRYMCTVGYRCMNCGNVHGQAVCLAH